jgi:hypothetical protein
MIKLTGSFNMPPMNKESLIKMLRSLPPQKRIELLNSAKQKRQMPTSRNAKPSLIAKKS